MVSRRRETLDFRSRSEFAGNKGFIELACNVASVSKVWTDCNHFSAAANRALSGVKVEQIWRSIVVENVVVICILLVVKGNLYYRLAEHVGGWWVADYFSRVYDFGGYFGQVLEHTEGIIWIVDALIFEWMEVSTFQEYLGASWIWTSVRLEFCDCGPWVVPEEEIVFRVLLVVQRDRKGNRFLDHIWKWRHADHVIWIYEGSHHWFCTECAPCVLIEVQKVLSPDLNNSLTVLWTISRVNSEHSCRWVVSEGHWVAHVREVSRQTDRKGNYFSLARCRTIITLKTGIILKFKLRTKIIILLCHDDALLSLLCDM